MINGSLSIMRKDFNHLCQLRLDTWETVQLYVSFSLYKKIFSTTQVIHGSCLVKCRHSDKENQVWVPHVESFLGNIKTYLHFLSFLTIEMMQLFEILPHERQGPVYSTYSIAWLLMTWRRKEPGHQQLWYWLHFSPLRWHRYLKSFLIKDKHLFILHTQ